MFRIGEFSKIAQIPISQLRYYDERGLFRPEQVDTTTGYRYYSAQQLPVLNRIIALKELGLSLAQVQQMLDDRVSADEIRGMLALKKAQVEQTIEVEQARLRTIEARLQHITSDGEMNNFDVVVKSIPASPYLSVRDTFTDACDGLRIAHELFNLYTRDPKTFGYFTALIYGDNFAMTNVDVEMGLLAARLVRLVEFSPNAGLLQLDANSTALAPRIRVGRVRGSV